MQTCTRCHHQSPDTADLCVNCGADLSEFSETAVALRLLQANPRVQYVRVASAGDCCPVCRDALATYPKEGAPPLPVEGCSHPRGCRCFYAPVLEEIYP